VATNDTAITETFNATAYDMKLDYGGTSGVTFPSQTASGSNTLTGITDPSTLSQYTGTQTVSVSESAVTHSMVSGGGNLFASVTTTAYGSVTIVYHYTPFCPGTGGGPELAAGSNYTGTFGAGTPEYLAWSAKPAAATVTVYVDSQSGNVNADQLARIQDALAQFNRAGSGLHLLEVADPALADVIVRNAAATDVGSKATGVLGSTEFMYNQSASGTIAGGSPFYHLLGPVNVALITGWNWYAGASMTVPADQYDYESVALHELARAVGINYSSGPQSVGLASLSMGETRRQLNETDVGQLTLRYTPAAIGDSASSSTLDAAPTDSSPFQVRAANTAASAPAEAGTLSTRSGGTVGKTVSSLFHESLALLIASGESHAPTLVTLGTATEIETAGPALTTAPLPVETHLDWRDAYWLSSGGAPAGFPDILQESDVPAPLLLAETVPADTVSAPATSDRAHEATRMLSPELSDTVFRETAVLPHEEVPWLNLSQRVSPALAAVLAAGFVAVHPPRETAKDLPSPRRRRLA
jgi:hypothetical protein